MFFWIFSRVKVSWDLIGFWKVGSIYKNRINFDFTLNLTSKLSKLHHFHKKQQHDLTEIQPFQASITEQKLHKSTSHILDPSHPDKHNDICLWRPPTGWELMSLGRERAQRFKLDLWKASVCLRRGDTLMAVRNGSASSACDSGRPSIKTLSAEHRAHLHLCLFPLSTGQRAERHTHADHISSTRTQVFTSMSLHLRAKRPGDVTHAPVIIVTGKERQQSREIGICFSHISEIDPNLFRWNITAF